MGHVSSGPFSVDSEGADLPRRQYRRSRSTRDPHLANLAPGVVGEWLAAWFLSQLGYTIIGRNIPVGRGEIDLLVSDGRRRFVVEVRSLVGSEQPLDAVTDAKRDRVRALAGQLGVARCDAIGVGLHSDWVIIHWDPDSF